MPLGFVREMSTGELLRSSFQLHRQFFVPLALAYGLPNLPASVLQLSIPLAGGGLGGLILLWALWFVMFILGVFVSYTAIILVISDACVGNKPNIIRSFLRARELGPKLIGGWLRQFLILFVGFMLLIVPGLIFTVRYFAVPIVLVLEGGQISDAFRRSRQLVAGSSWRVFGNVMLINLILLTIIYGAIFILGVLIGLLMAATGNATTSPVTLVAEIGGLIMTYALYPVLFVALVLMYFDLRVRKEAYDSMTLASELAS
jgi:hypothetical protein